MTLLEAVSCLAVECIVYHFCHSVLTCAVAAAVHFVRKAIRREVLLCLASGHYDIATVQRCFSLQQSGSHVLHEQPRARCLRSRQASSDGASLSA